MAVQAPAPGVRRGSVWDNMLLFLSRLSHQPRSGDSLDVGRGS